MKRTEDIFEFPVSLKLEKCTRGAIRIEVAGVGVIIDDSIPDFIAALQQFQETGTFVKPKRYAVVQSGSKPGLYIIKDAVSEENLRRSSISGGSMYLSESQANRIADILNEEGEE